MGYWSNGCLGICSRVVFQMVLASSMSFFICSFESKNASLLTLNLFNASCFFSKLILNLSLTLFIEISLTLFPHTGCRGVHRLIFRYLCIAGILCSFRSDYNPFLHILYTKSWRPAGLFQFPNKKHIFSWDPRHRPGPCRYRPGNVSALRADRTDPCPIHRKRRTSTLLSFGFRIVNIFKFHYFSFIQ